MNVSNSKFTEIYEKAKKLFRTGEVIQSRFNPPLEQMMTQFSNPTKTHQKIIK